MAYGRIADAARRFSVGDHGAEDAEASGLQQNEATTWLKSLDANRVGSVWPMSSKFIGRR